jgi:signal transduction histidine kinase
MNAGLAWRITLALALLLLAFGLFVAALVRQVAQQSLDTGAQQRVHGLAQHIVGRWPVVQSGAEATEGDAAARQALLQMLVTVNPSIQVYLLDADGTVAHYLGEPGMVQTPRVDLAAVRAFLGGATLPLRGTDPMGGPPRPFSAAMFPPRAGQARPPGYLYIVLADAPAPAGLPLWQGAAGAVAVGLLCTLLAGALVLRRLTLPLHRVARRMAAFELDRAGTLPPPATRHRGDEVAAIEQAFHRLDQRIAEQARARAAEAAAHREVMAGVAHDMRTPLTALHGHLEALGTAGAAQPALVKAALAQSDRVRRLTQQLFELATLQSTHELPHRERFRLDELVSDTVQTFDPGASGRRVALLAPAQQPVLLDGDLHLIERALGNLIDNALRHAAGHGPVRVSLHCEGPQVQVRVADSGPGLPAVLAERLQAGAPVREPPPRRPGGGVGGLGLAIAQRVAVLHGGSLRLLPAPGPGTLLALVLPLPAPGAATPG